MAELSEVQVTRPDGYVYTARHSPDTVKELKASKFKVSEVKRRKPANKQAKPENKDSGEKPAKGDSKEKDSGQKA